jgi:hypothetical protein
MQVILWPAIFWNKKKGEVKMKIFLKSTRLFTLFCIGFLICIFHHPKYADAEEEIAIKETSTKRKVSERILRRHYRIGIMSLRKGIASLDRAMGLINEGLLENKVRIKDLYRLFGKNKVSLSRFLQILTEEYQYKGFMKACKIIESEAMINFETSRKQFQKLSELDPNSVDGLIGLSTIALYLGLNKDALELFTKAKILNLKKIKFFNVFGKDLENYFTRLALMCERARLQGEDFGIQGEAIIKELMNLRSKKLRDLLDSEDSVDKRFEELYLLNKFQLVKFYLDLKNKKLAKKEFKKVYEGDPQEEFDKRFGQLQSYIELNSDLFPEVLDEVEALSNEIEYLKECSVIDLRLSPTLANFYPKIEISFSQTADSLVGVEDLEFLLDEKIQQVCFDRRIKVKGPDYETKIISGYYKVEMKIEGFEIIEKNKIPFRVCRKGKDWEYHEDLKPELFFEFISGKRVERLHIRSNEYKIWTEGFYKHCLINPETGKRYKLKKGPFKANLTFSNMLFQAGKAYQFEFISMEGMKYPEIRRGMSRTIAKGILGLLVLLFFTAR